MPGTKLDLFDRTAEKDLDLQLSLYSGMDTVFGATGEADAAVDAYLKGELETDPAAIFAPGTPCC